MKITAIMDVAFGVVHPEHQGIDKAAIQHLAHLNLSHFSID
jgi:hypothetical protein